MKRVHRYEVPIDGTSHLIPDVTRPLHIAATANGTVEFWAESYADKWALLKLPTEDQDRLNWPADRFLRVVGTGEPIPLESVYYGTTQRTPDGLVWHLYGGEW